MSNINLNDGVKYWRGKRIIPLDQWFKIKRDYNLKAALQFFPDDYPTCGLPSISDHIPDANLKEDADKWYSEYKNLMGYRRNPTYGHEKCFHCLLNPAREQSKLFLGIDRIFAKALERCYKISSSPTLPSIYPCPVLNIFECPYAKKDNKEEEGEDGNTFDTGDLFDLSEVAFQLELALRKAEVMTKSNDTIYEADFETGKVRQLGHFGDLSDDEPFEERLAEVKRLSKVPIRNRSDIYHALTDKESLDKVLEQGLDEENQKYKEQIVQICMSLKDCILKERGDNTRGSYGNDPQGLQRQHAECFICLGFANIHCINCSDVWLCADHWKQHKNEKHNCW